MITKRACIRFLRTTDLFLTIPKITKYISFLRCLFYAGITHLFLPLLSIPL